MTPKFHTLAIKDIRQETEDTVSISFDIPSELLSHYHFSPGQYLTLKSIIEGEDIRRSYSLCSSPFENEWRVAVKQVHEGRFSGFANSSLKSGDQLEVMTPMGNFKVELNADQSKSYVFFAAGSGITPIFSIIKSILHLEPKSQISLFYSNKGFASVIFREELEALKNLHMDRFRLIHIFSRESLGNSIQKGRIDLPKCNSLYTAFLKGSSVDEVYICGPEEMIFAVKESMLAQGVDAAHIHYELFTTPGVKKEAKIQLPHEIKVDSNVSIIVDGDRFDLALTSDGDSVLDAAVKAGADLPYACKGGVCCTCKARILEGSARMDVNYALEEDEVEAGYILTCQAHPTSEKLVVSFDD